MSNIYMNYEGVIVVSKKRHGDSNISLQLHSEKIAKQNEWRVDAEDVFSSRESILKHAIVLANSLVERNRLKKHEILELDFNVKNIINSIPDNMMNTKHIVYINKLVQSEVTRYLKVLGK